MTKIDTNVPVPPRSKYPFATMRKGDSFAVEGRSKKVKNRLTGSIAYFRRCNPNTRKRFTVRLVGEGYRVWRVR